MDLAVPVGHDAGRCHNQGADIFLVLSQIHQQSDGLQRLSQAHVIGQDASRPNVVDESQPRQALFLIRAQRGFQGAWLLGLLDIADIRQLREQLFGCGGQIARIRLLQKLLDAACLG